MTRHRFNAFLAAVAAAALLAPAAFAQAPEGLPVPGPRLEAAKPGAKAVPGVRTINWDELVPKDWDPMKEFRGMDLAVLQDGDPRAVALMRKMREVWDNAPTNDALAGQAVRLPGFIVPLEETKDGLKEFLLVPYFGACIHSPPPPANQIVHVLPKTPVKARSMDPVWVTGPLALVKTDSYMGAAGYRIEATRVEPYTQDKR